MWVEEFEQIRYSGETFYLFVCLFLKLSFCSTNGLAGNLTHMSVTVETQLVGVNLTLAKVTVQIWQRSLG